MTASIQRVGLSGSVTSASGGGHYTMITALKNVQGGTGTAERRMISSGGVAQSRVITQSSIGSSVSVQVASSFGLPLPEGISYKYSQDWSEEETSSLQQFMGKAGNLNLSDVGSMGAYLKGLGVNVAVGKASQSMFKKALADRGAAYNPFRELFYSGVKFRTFSFKWSFAPISAQESQAVDDFIHAMTVAAHPEFLAGPQSPFWIPDQFEVDFVNTRIPRLRSLACTDVDVDYSPAESGPKFFDGDSRPAFVDVTVDFIETAILTKQWIERLRK